mgnify:CR=1 FL=1
MIGIMTDEQRAIIGELFGAKARCKSKGIEGRIVAVAVFEISGPDFLVPPCSVDGLKAPEPMWVNEKHIELIEEKPK